MDTVRAMCQRAAWLDHGEIKAIGEPIRSSRLIGEGQVEDIMFEQTEIPGVLIFSPRFLVTRGASLWKPFVQICSPDRASPGSLFRIIIPGRSRDLAGLHYQIRHTQGKLVRTVAGEIFDVAVDLRRSSETFGHWVGARLSAKNKKQIWIPPGFAHGFYVLSEWAEVVYKTTDYYAPSGNAACCGTILLGNRMATLARSAAGSFRKRFARQVVGRSGAI